MPNPGRRLRAKSPDSRLAKPAPRRGHACHHPRFIETATTGSASCSPIPGPLGYGSALEVIQARGTGLGPDDEISEDVVVTLTDPRMQGDELTYNANVIEGGM